MKSQKNENCRHGLQGNLKLSGRTNRLFHYCHSNFCLSKEKIDKTGCHIPRLLADNTMVVEVFLVLDDTKMEDTSKVVDISSLQQ